MRSTTQEADASEILPPHEQSMGTKDPRVEAYISKANDFAKPILTHLRVAVYAACPAVEEDMKWSAPPQHKREYILAGCRRR